MEEKITFYVVDRNYEIFGVYCGYKELFDCCFYAIRNGVIGNSFVRTSEGRVDIYVEYLSYILPICKYIIQDKNGSTLPVQLILKHFNDLNYKEKQNKYYTKEKVNWEFRKDPVPGTGAYRKRMRRHQKYAQELRCNIRDAEYARPKRKEEIHYLSLWAYDQYRSDIFNFYSWKKCKKKKQWM